MKQKLLNIIRGFCYEIGYMVADAAEAMIDWAAAQPKPRRVCSTRLRQIH